MANKLLSRVIKTGNAPWFRPFLFPTRVQQFHYLHYNHLPALKQLQTTISTISFSVNTIKMPEFLTTDVIVADKIHDQDPILSCSLLRIPPELTLQIFENMDNSVDKLCFGLSCRRLLHVFEQLKVKVPCLKQSRRNANIHRENKLAFSLMARVYPMDSQGNIRADVALCGTCFKWMKMHHEVTSLWGSSTKIQSSDVFPYESICGRIMAGILFDCAKCVLRNGRDENERRRRLGTNRLFARIEPHKFGSAQIWASRVSMGSGTVVDP